MTVKALTRVRAGGVFALMAVLLLALAFALPAQAVETGVKANSATAVTLKSGDAAKQDIISLTAAKVDTKLQTQAKVRKVYTATQYRNIGRYKGGTFKIMKNITLPNEEYYLTISKNKKYTIDLNGKKIITAYKGVSLRTVCPLFIKKGTVVMKSSKKNKGVFYSRETAAVTVQGSAKFYLKSGSIVNDAVEFRSDITSAVMLYGKAKFYLQGKSKIRSIGNGIALFGSSKLVATGSPYVRAGANQYTGQFMHYGSGISIASKNARITLKGGSYGTKASQDTTVYTPAISMTYAQSANYPILDMYGKAIKKAVPKDYKVINGKKKKVGITGTGVDDYYNGVNAPDLAAVMEALGYDYPRIQKYSTTVKDANGYYTVYIRKK